LAVKPVNKKDDLKRDDFRKGMVLIDTKLKPAPIWEFEAQIKILHHSTTIRCGYEAVMHCGLISQAVRIEKMDKEILRSGATA